MAFTLPIVGTRESISLELKSALGYLDEEKKKLLTDFERAKDVAAMANAMGGTIIVGGERDGDKLGKYLPVPRKIADEIAGHYERCVRDRCRPSPDFEPVVHEHDAGLYLVLVHVRPSTAVVAVKVAGSKDDGWSGEAWVYFEKTTSHARPISPDRLPMLMVPEIRRTVIGLMAILAEKEANPALGRVVVRYRNNKSYGFPYTQDGSGQIMDLDEAANTVRFQMLGIFAPACFGLEEIFSVSRLTPGQWCVKLKEEQTSGPMTFVPAGGKQ